ncbi:hypothetical protein HA402_003148 [Bradysia odoriphaga]|nr:hypothetical protein HA402_003148 [Bradysia odoriphaga]
MCQELILIKSQLRQLQDKNFELQKNNLVLKSQLRPQQDMIFEMQKNNLDLRCQLRLQQDIIFELQKNNWVLKSQLQPQQDMIFELQKNNLDLSSQLRLQQDMIFELQKNNWVLKSQLEPQQDMIFELRKNNSDLRSRVKQQYELTSELRKQELTEIHRLKLQLSLDERLHLQQTQVDQGPTADRKQSVEFDNVATIQQSQGRNLEEVEQTAHLTPLYQGQADNFDQSESSLKQIHSIRNSKDTAKRITYNMESSEASGKNPRNYCKIIPFLYLVRLPVLPSDSYWKPPSHQLVFGKVLLRMFTGNYGKH